MRELVYVHTKIHVHTLHTAAQMGTATPFTTMSTGPFMRAEWIQGPKVQFKRDQRSEKCLLCSSICALQLLYGSGWQLSLIAKDFM